MMKYTYQKIFLFCTALYTANTLAQAYAIKQQDPNEQFSSSMPKILDKPVYQHSSPEQKTPQNIELTEQQLAQQPELIKRGFIPALLENNAPAVKILYPLYRDLADPDPYLLDWGQAILDKEKGNYPQAIKRYRKLFAINPDILPLRYQLAQTLWLNNDNIAAKDQFEKLRAENISPQFNQLMDQYIDSLNKRDQWEISFGLNYISESNINNAPKTPYIGQWKTWQKESAKGLGYHLNLNKKWSLPHQLFSKFESQLYGKYYWDNQKYNELNLRLGIGLGYQNAQQQISLTPFVEKRWYAGGSQGSNSLKQYADNAGMRVYFSQWLSPNWQAISWLEYAKQRYKTRHHLNSNHYFWSNSLIYLPHSEQYWLIGADYQRDNTRDKDNAFDRKSLRLGWGQEWKWGISSFASFNYARRKYKVADFFNIQQKNNEYAMQISLWHRNIHFFGVTPRLTWQYQKYTSNHPLYQYDKNRLYLELSKRF